MTLDRHFEGTLLALSPRGVAGWLRTRGFQFSAPYGEHGDILTKVALGGDIGSDALDGLGHRIGTFRRDDTVLRGADGGFGRAYPVLRAGRHDARRQKRDDGHSAKEEPLVHVDLLVRMGRWESPTRRNRPRREKPGKCRTARCLTSGAGPASLGSARPVRKCRRRSAPPARCRCSSTNAPDRRRTPS